MEWLKVISDDYANGITAIATCSMLILAVVTLFYVKSEYSKKYSPCVIPVVNVEPIVGTLGCVVSIIPNNVGSHPCMVKISKIRLHIGDESYETPDINWIQVGPHGAGIIQIPVGHVKEIGVRKIRESRYSKNRIELSFMLEAKSNEDEYQKTKSFIFEINVLGEKPVSMFRPE